MHNFELFIGLARKRSHSLQELKDITLFVNEFFGGQKITAIRTICMKNPFGRMVTFLRIELDADTITASYVDVIHAILYCIKWFYDIDFSKIEVVFG